MKICFHWWMWAQSQVFNFGNCLLIRPTRKNVDINYSTHFDFLFHWHELLNLFLLVRFTNFRFCTVHFSFWFFRSFHLFDRRRSHRCAGGSDRFRFLDVPPVRRNKKKKKKRRRERNVINERINACSCCVFGRRFLPSIVSRRHGCWNSKVFAFWRGNEGFASGTNCRSDRTFGRGHVVLYVRIFG